MPQVLGRTPFAVAPAQVGAKGRLARAPVLAGGSACDVGCKGISIFTEQAWEEFFRARATACGLPLRSPCCHLLGCGRGSGAGNLVLQPG